MCFRRHPVQPRRHPPSDKQRRLQLVARTAVGQQKQHCWSNTFPRATGMENDLRRHRQSEARKQRYVSWSWYLRTASGLIVTSGHYLALNDQII